MASTLCKLESGIQQSAVTILNREDANFAVEEQRLCKEGNGFMELIQGILGAALDGVVQEAVEIERDEIVTLACTISPLGTRDELFIAIANRCESILQLRQMVTSLKDQVHGEHLVAFKSEATQLAAALGSVAQDAKTLSTDLLLQVLACSRSLLATFGQLVNLLATYRSVFTFVHRKAGGAGQQRVFLQAQQAAAQNEAGGEFLWDATPLSVPVDLDQGLSLNQWLLSIINPGSLPTEEVQRFKKALCNTSPGVASCAVMVNKLREALRPPPSLKGSNVVQTATTFLLKWIDCNYADLNEHVCVVSLALTLAHTDHLAEPGPPRRASQRSAGGRHVRGRARCSAASPCHTC